MRATGFRPAEQVTVTAQTRTRAVRRGTTTASGSLDLVFAGIAVGRCERLVVTAVGASGDRATLRRMPECTTQ